MLPWLMAAEKQYSSYLICKLFNICQYSQQFSDLFGNIGFHLVVF